MDPKRIKTKNRPEAKIQSQWKTFLEARNWYVKATHGGMYQSGFPDLYITHPDHGGKWVEIKLPHMQGSQFTKAQKECFPLFAQHGTPIWILTNVCEQEYRKLLEIPQGNWMEYFLLKGW